MPSSRASAAAFITVRSAHAFAGEKVLTKTIARYGRGDLLCIDELGNLICWWTIRHAPRPHLREPHLFSGTQSIPVFEMPTETADR